MSNGLDPDQDQHFVGPGLGPICLQMLSEDNKSSPAGMERDKYFFIILSLMATMFSREESSVKVILTGGIICRTFTRKVILLGPSVIGPVL